MDMQTKQDQRGAPVRPLTNGERQEAGEIFARNFPNLTKWRKGISKPLIMDEDDREQRTLGWLAQVDKRLEEVAAENRRLREALKAMFEHEGEREISGIGIEHDSDALEAAKEAARAALAGGGQ